MVLLDKFWGIMPELSEVLSSYYGEKGLNVDEVLANLPAGYLLFLGYGASQLLVDDVDKREE